LARIPEYKEERTDLWLKNGTENIIKKGPGHSRPKPKKKRDRKKTGLSKGRILALEC